MNTHLRRHFAKLLSVSIFVILIFCFTASADVLLCQFKKGARKGQIVQKKNEKCNKSQKQVARINNIYGNNSRVRNLTINSNFHFESLPIGRYKNITIAQGAELRLSSGALIRCSGTLVNNGLIKVFDGASGGYRKFNNLGTSEIIVPGRAASPGVSNYSASNGGISRFEDIKAASGVVRHANASGIRTLQILPYGGGGGGAGYVGGGNGGGSAMIFCKGKIENNGLITANGSDSREGGGGGGAGGVLILASESMIESTAGITATGGFGGNATVDGDLNGIALAGGGGSGGIVHVIAPRISIADNLVSVDGGGAGFSNNYDLSAYDYRFGGGSGGSIIGGGGGGAWILNDQIISASDGSDGYFIQTTAYPSSFLAGM